LRLSDIANMPLAPGTKGLPLDGSIVQLGDLAGRDLNVLRGDLPVPIALLKRSALENNLEVMQAYVERAGVQLAPHAKTTLCPQLFMRQLNHGCWGLSVATMTQFKLCHDLGVGRMILANQLVGRAEIAGLARLWATTPEREYHVLVDSQQGAAAISAGFSECTGAPAARLLIEMGMPDGRCGVRSLEEGLALARLIRSLPHVELHGVEGYEGSIVSDHADRDAAEVSNYLSTLLRLYELLVISRPQPNQAIVIMGKRDVSYDIDLPTARWSFREGRDDTPQSVTGCVVNKLNDQHAHLAVPTDADLAVGDLIGFEISHPCTTFDKWSLLLEVDDAYTVVGGLKTFFESSN